MRKKLIILTCVVFLVISGCTLKTARKVQQAREVYDNCASDQVKDIVNDKIEKNIEDMKDDAEEVRGDVKSNLDKVKEKIQEYKDIFIKRA